MTGQPRLDAPRIMCSLLEGAHGWFFGVGVGVGVGVCGVVYYLRRMGARRNPAFA